MKPVSEKRMCKILRAHVWTFDHINGAHHVYVREEPSASIPVPVHGNRDLKSGTQKAIMRQAGLTDADL